MNLGFYSFSGERSEVVHEFAIPNSRQDKEPASARISRMYSSDAKGIIQLVSRQMKGGAAAHVIVTYPTTKS
jgi:hypothetical protein